MGNLYNLFISMSNEAYQIVISWLTWSYCSFSETTMKQIEDAFKEFTAKEDVGIILISQYVSFFSSWHSVILSLVFTVRHAGKLLPTNTCMTRKNYLMSFPLQVNACQWNNSIMSLCLFVFLTCCSTNRFFLCGTGGFLIGKGKISQALAVLTHQTTDPPIHTNACFSITGLCRDPRTKSL